MINNYKDFKKFLSTINQEKKPKLLLHSCCGPCSTHTLFLLKDYFDITIYFTNDNIYPEAEYDLRGNEQKKLLNRLPFKVDIIIDDFNPKNYYEAIKGFENLGEHSERCYRCYSFRMRKTANYAKENGFDFFTTTLSISPYKNSDWINQLGYELEKELDISYLYSNFKKEEGYKDSIKLSREFDLYRQEYCGCVFSLNESRLKE